MNTCMSGICECGATGFFLCNTKIHTTKRDSRPPHGRYNDSATKGTSGGGFRRNNPEAVCVAALLIAPREKAGGELKEDFTYGLCG